MTILDAGADDDKATKPFLDHLEDLRRTIIRCAVTLGLGMLIAFPLAPFILGLLKGPLTTLVDDPDRFLRSLEVSGAFTVALRTSLWSGLLFSAPFILLFIGQFVFPGLTERERDVTLKSSGFAVGLFALGVYFGYAVILKLALAVMFRLHDWLGIQAEWTVTSYVAFAIHMLIAFGVAFEMPVVVVILGKLGILTSQQLREKRRHVIVVLLIVAMLLTPPDPFTQVAMALPLALLYELCIWIVWFAEKKQKNESTI